MKAWQHLEDIPKGSTVTNGKEIFTVEPWISAPVEPGRFGIYYRIKRWGDGRIFRYHLRNPKYIVLEEKQND